MAMMRWADAPVKRLSGVKTGRRKRRVSCGKVQARHADRIESYVYDPTIWWSPLARITQQLGGRDGDIRWFNTDLNGAPLEMTDAEGAVRWSGDYGSFGAVNGQTQDSEGLRHGKPVESQPLRYAGQYADEETGLHYNLFRYYDPVVGRFTTQDPIGLAEGAESLSVCAESAYMDRSVGVGEVFN